MHIRWQIIRDVPEIVTLSETTAEPFTQTSFLEVVASRSTICMVAEDGDKILGFMIYELHKARLHLKYLVVGQPARRQGTGRSLVMKLVSKLSTYRRERITATVRERNLSVQLFLRSLKFTATSIAHRYFSDTEEDAYVMQFRIPTMNSVLAETE